MGNGALCTTEVLAQLRIQTFLAAVNFALLLVSTTLLFTTVVLISNSESLSDAQHTASHVRTITGNLVPISEVTRTAALSNSTSNVTLAQAATDAMTGFGQADWSAVVGNATIVMGNATIVMGNATIVMGTVANINFSAVTGLFAQAQEPQNQAVIRKQLDHAFSSFDFASQGVTNIFKIFRDGIISEGGSSYKKEEETI